VTGPEISADRVLAEEARIAFADPRAVYGPDGEPLPPHRLDEDTARALAAMEVVESTSKSGETTVRRKYKFWDKRAALDRLARHLGLAAPDPAGEGEPGEAVTFVLNLAGDGGDEDPERDDGEDGDGPDE
jgi:phage terminase small subunit